MRVLRVIQDNGHVVSRRETEGRGLRLISFPISDTLGIQSHALAAISDLKPTESLAVVVLLGINIVREETQNGRLVSANWQGLLGALVIFAWSATEPGDLVKP